MMPTLSPGLIESYGTLLAQKGVPEAYRPFYLKWLRFYLDFCGKYGYPIGKASSLPCFLQKLESKKQPEAYRKQAENAVTIYYQLLEGERNRFTG